MNVSILRKVQAPFRATQRSAAVDFYTPSFDDQFIVDFLILNKFAKKVEIYEEQDPSKEIASKTFMLPTSRKSLKKAKQSLADLMNAYKEDLLFDESTGELKISNKESINDNNFDIHKFKVRVAVGKDAYYSLPIINHNEPTIVEERWFPFDQKSYRDPISKTIYGYSLNKKTIINYNKSGQEIFENNIYNCVDPSDSRSSIKSVSIKKSINFLHSVSLPIIDQQYIYVYPHQTVVIPSGISVRIPDNYFLYLIDKSGIAINTNLKTNAGIIDFDFKNEIGFIIFNTTDEVKKIEANKRLVQGILIPCLSEPIEVKNYFDLYTDLISDRNGGFGSTGTH